MKAATHFLKCANCISCEFVWNQYPQPGNRRNVATCQYINSAKISHRIKVSPAARSFRRVVLRAAKVRQAAAVSRDFSFFLLFFNNRSCLWNHYIVGLRFQHPRFWTRDKPGGGGKLWNKNGTTKQGLPQKWGLSLCTVTNAHRHPPELCLMRNYLVFLVFFLLLWFSVKTKHAAYLVYAVRVTLEGEETDESKMPSLITGMTESASTWRHRPRLLFPSLSPSLLYNHLYHCIRRSSGKGLLQLPSCTLMWLKNWPLVPLFVCFGDRWIHLNKKKTKNRCFGICPPFSRWCLCGWHSQTKEPWWISTLWRVPETLQYKLLAHPQTKKRLTLNVLPPPTPPYSPRTTAGRHTSVCCDLKRKIKLLRSPGFHFENSALVYASVTDPAQVSGGCAQKPERWTELCVIFSYFQKSLIVIVTLRKH